MSPIVKRIRNRAAQAVRSTAEDAACLVFNRRMSKDKVDPRITYPCYKSFDEFIDVERLKSLDEYITEIISRHIETQKDEQFHTGALRLKVSSPKKPGSRIIYLAKPLRPFSYFDLDKPELWERTKEVDEFSLLMDFIDTLPFKQTARMMIMYDDTGKPVTAHRDHASLEVCHEFIWFRTNLNKPFYVLNDKTNEKKYVESYSAWFDTCNQFHGADAHQGLSFSIRVDGIFSDELRGRIPTPEYNRASTSALWACASG